MTDSVRTGHRSKLRRMRGEGIRYDAVDANLVRSKLDRHGARHVDHSCFGRRVGDAVMTPDHSGRRTEIDDFSTPSLLHHLLGDILGYQVRTLQTDRDDLVEFLFGAVKKISVIR